MIVFDLKCSSGHVFEAWFGSSAGYEEQRSGGMIACPVCSDTDIGKALMAPNIGVKGNRASVPARQPMPMPMPSEPPSPAAIKAALAAIASVQAKALETSEWVGPRFAARARAMHAGDEPETPIHGQATLAEAEALVEDGVPIAPLLVPVVPPQARN